MLRIDEYTDMTGLTPIAAIEAAVSCVDDVLKQLGLQPVADAVGMKEELIALRSLFYEVGNQPLDHNRELCRRVVEAQAVAEDIESSSRGLHLLLHLVAEQFHADIVEECQEEVYAAREDPQ